MIGFFMPGKKPMANTGESAALVNKHQFVEIPCRISPVMGLHTPAGPSRLVTRNCISILGSSRTCQAQNLPRGVFQSRRDAKIFRRELWVNDVSIVIYKNLLADFLNC